MLRSRALTSCLLAMVVSCGLVRPSSAQTLGPEVRAVEFEGNETFPDDSLARAIVTSKTECRSWVFRITLLCALDADFALRRSELREQEIPRDAVRLQIWYQRRGFREVDVSGTFALRPDSQAVVRFSIVEGRPALADSITFVGAEDFVAVGMLDNLPIETGDRWSTLALDATRDTLVRRLRNRGYPYVDVLRQTILPAGEPYHAHVIFEVEPGTRARYGEIRVEGIDHLSESTILRTLPFRSGDPYRLDQLIDAQSRLFGLEIVRSATVTPCLDSNPSCAGLGPTPDSIVPLVVRVQEGDPYRVRAGAGGSTAECANVESRWTSRNFLGGGRVLQVRGRLSNVLTPQFRDLLCWQSGEEEFARLTWTAGVDFAQPWIFSTRNSFNASLFAERQSVPEIFIRKAVGLQLALVRAVGPRTPLTLSYRPELSSLAAAEVLLCTGFLVCTRQDIDVLTSAQRLAPVGLNLTRDLSNSLLNPTRGYRLIVDLEHASGWTGSELEYDRAIVEGRWYSGLTGRSVLAARIRGGWVGSGGGSGPTGIVPPQKRFYAGGANSVRGFAQSRLGPLVLVVDPARLLDVCTTAQVVDLSCDAGALLSGDFTSRPTGGTRVLEGNVEVRFGLGREFEGVTFADFGQVWGVDQGIALEGLEITPGVGIRYASPVGPIRVDLGYNTRGDEELSVVTTRIEPGPGGPDDYVRTSELGVLGPRVSFGGSESHFQLHISIGQAF